jgi:predicted AAA+ superfamily ATPase
MAVATSPYQPRSVSDFMALPATEQGKFYEWLVAQELWRRNSLTELEYQGELSYYRDGENELDFIVNKNSAIEVKRGQASPHEFQWLHAEHPNMTVKVICTNTIDMQRVSSVSMEEFLLSEADVV